MLYVCVNHFNIFFFNMAPSVSTAPFFCSLKTLFAIIFGDDWESPWSQSMFCGGRTMPAEITTIRQEPLPLIIARIAFHAPLLNAPLSLSLSVAADCYFIPSIVFFSSNLSSVFFDFPLDSYFFFFHLLWFWCCKSFHNATAT